MPVTLPPGRLKLATRPSWTGSAPVRLKTMGTVVLAALATSAGGGPPRATITATWKERFRTPQLLVEHGNRRAMNVILQGNNSSFGVLEVDGRSEGEFSENDITF